MDGDKPGVDEFIMVIDKETKAYIDRFIQTHQNRIAPKGFEHLTKAQKYIYDFFKQKVQREGTAIVKRDEISSESSSQLLPTDFCYNLANVAPDFDIKFLLSRGKGEYEFVDFLWRSNTPIKIQWTPKGRYVPLNLRNRTFYVGVYQHGHYEWNFNELRKLS